MLTYNTYGDTLLNLQIQIFQYDFQWKFRAQLPNLIPTSISGYTVCQN